MFRPQFSNKSLNCDILHAPTPIKADTLSIKKVKLAARSGRDQFPSHFSLGEGRRLGNDTDVGKRCPDVLLRFMGTTSENEVDSSHDTFFTSD
jgi:hypothetical protein